MTHEERNLLLTLARYVMATGTYGRPAAFNDAAVAFRDALAALEREPAPTGAAPGDEKGAQR